MNLTDWTKGMKNFSVDSEDVFMDYCAISDEMTECLEVSFTQDGIRCTETISAHAADHILNTLGM